jgi:hypothetical protein
MSGERASVGRFGFNGQYSVNCAWQTRPFRPPGLKREGDRKLAISITGETSKDTQSKPAIAAMEPWRKEQC